MATSFWLRVAAYLGLNADVGQAGERVAARYLRRRGLRQVARNVRLGHGEIDLIAWEGQTLVFVEVKSRSAGSRAEITGLEKIGAAKLRVLRRGCGRYLQRLQQAPESYRLDAVTVELRKRRWWGYRVTEVRWYVGIAALADI